MALSNEQLDLIRRRATFQKVIFKVMLYGSHYHGGAQPDSDTDLALWITGSDHQERWAAFLVNRPRWQRELTEQLGPTVIVGLGGGVLVLDAFRHTCRAVSLCGVGRVQEFQ